VISQDVQDQIAGIAIKFSESVGQEIGETIGRTIWSNLHIDSCD